MDIDLDREFFGGLRFREVRRFLRKDCAPEPQHLAEFFEVDQRKAKALLGATLKAGLFKKKVINGAGKRFGEVEYRLTPIGKSIALSSPYKRMTRAQADALVGKFLAAVEAINASECYIYRVHEVRVFGSYLADRADLGDVDIAVALAPRPEYASSPEVLERANRQRYAQSNRYADLYCQLNFGSYEVARILKRVSRRISLHPIDDLTDIMRKAGKAVDDHSAVIYPTRTAPM
jgi:predicted nucleotidyltransferase